MDVHRTTMDPLVSGAETCRLPESEYFRELAELLQESLGPSLNSSDDMWMLREMLKQLKEKKPPAVQEGDVSSTGETSASSAVGDRGPLSASHVGPMVLEALDGFFFVLNPDAMFEFVSQNVFKYLRFTQSEMLNRSIFNFISPNDHELFSKLLPDHSFSFSMVNPTPAPGERKSQSFQCRFLTQPSDPSPPNGGTGTDTDGQTEGTAVCSTAASSISTTTFLPFHVSAISLPYPAASPDAGSSADYFNGFPLDNDSERRCIVCVARRQSDKPTAPQWPTVSTDFKLTCGMDAVIVDVEIRDPAFSSLMQLKGKSITAVSTQFDFDSLKTGKVSSMILLPQQFSNGCPLALRTQSRTVANNGTTVLEIHCSIDRSNNPSSEDTTRPQAYPQTAQRTQLPVKTAPIPYPGTNQVPGFAQLFDNVSPETLAGDETKFATGKSLEDPLQQLCSSIFEQQPPQQQPQQQRRLDALPPRLPFPAQIAMQAPSFGQNHFNQQLAPEQQQMWFDNNRMIAPPTTTACAVGGDALLGQNPYFYHPDSYPGGQSYLPGGVPKDETTTTVKKKSAPRKPRAKAGTTAANANTVANGGGTTTTTPAAKRSAANRRKRSAAGAAGTGGKASSTDSSATTPTATTAQQPALPPPTTSQVATVVYQQWPMVSMQQMGGEMQPGPHQHLTNQQSMFQPSGMHPQLVGVQEVAVPMQMTRMTPTANGPGGGGRKDQILKQLLKSSSETSPDSTTPREDHLQQQQRAFAAPPGGGFVSPNGQQTQQPYPSPSGGASSSSRPAASNSMLVKLLEHPPQHTPTLPTSIATSPLDKLAQENKGKPDQPSVSTRLAESLLTRQKPHQFPNGAAFLMPQRPSNIQIPPYACYSPSTANSGPPNSAGFVDATTLRSPIMSPYGQPQIATSQSPQTGFSPAAPISHPHQTPQLRLPNLRKMSAATPEHRPPQSVLSPPLSAPPLNQPQSPWFQAANQQSTALTPSTPTSSHYTVVHQDPPYWVKQNNNDNNNFTNANDNQSQQQQTFVASHSRQSPRQPPQGFGDVQSNDYSAQPDSTTQVNQAAFTFAQQQPFSPYHHQQQMQQQPMSFNNNDVNRQPQPYQQQQQNNNNNGVDAMNNATPIGGQQQSQNFLEPSVFDLGLGNSGFDMDDETTRNYVQSLLS